MGQDIAGLHRLVASSQTVREQILTGNELGVTCCTGLACYSMACIAGTCGSGFKTRLHITMMSTANCKIFKTNEGMQWLNISIHPHHPSSNGLWSDWYTPYRPLRVVSMMMSPCSTSYARIASSYGHVHACTSTPLYCFCTVCFATHANAHS